MLHCFPSTQVAAPGPSMQLNMSMLSALQHSREDRQVHPGHVLRASRLNAEPLLNTEALL